MFARTIERADGLDAKLEVAVSEYQRLVADGYDRDAALEDIGEWLAADIQRVDRSELDSVVDKVIAKSGGRTETGFVLAILLFRLARQTCRLQSQIAQRLLDLGIVDRMHSEPSYDGLRFEFLSEFRRLGKQWAERDHVRAFVAFIPEEQANMLAQRRAPAPVEAALKLYRKSLDELGALADEDVKVAEEYQAQTLNNFAQTWSERTSGDRREHLRRALELFRRCLEHPGRTRDSGDWYHTLQSYVVMARQLASFLDSSDERIELLESVVDRAWEGLGKLESHARDTFPTRDKAELHRNLWLAWANARFALLQEQGRDTELQEHCRDVLQEFDDRLGEKTAEFSMAKRKFEKEVYDESSKVEWKPASRAVVELANKLVREVRPLHREEALRLATNLDVLAKRLSRGEEYPDYFPWEALGYVMNQVSVRVTSVFAARELFQSEAALLMPIRESGEAPDECRDYLEEGKRACEKRLASALLAETHRRVLASRERWLSLCKLAIGDRGCGPSDPKQQLLDWEDSGAAAYRSDLYFWGQGPVERRNDMSQAITREPHWRERLHNARLSLDGAEFVEAMKRLASLYPRMFRDRDVIRRNMGCNLIELDVHLSGESEVSTRETPEQARRQLESVVRERAPGWSLPVETQETFSPDSENISDWLSERSETAVLVSTRDINEIFWADGQGELCCRSFDGQESEHRWETWRQELNELAGERIRFDTGENVDITEEMLAPGGCTISPGEMDPKDIRKQPPDDASARAFGDVLSKTLEQGSFLAEAIVKLANRHDLERLVVLPRGRSDLIPWENLSVDNSTLAEKLDVIRVYTLADAAPATRPERDDTVTCVPLGDSEDATSLGSAAFAPFDSIDGSMARTEFDDRAMEADVLRLFTHSTFDLSPFTSAFCLGPSAAPTSVETDLMQGTEDELEIENGWYTAGEVRSLDLRGCRRAELWGCESHFTTDLRGALFGEDEPIGLASAFLLAGTQRVVGAWWQVPIPPTVLIAAAFAQYIPEDGDAFDDACALAEAVSVYRSAVAKEGPMTRAVEKSLEVNLTDVDSVDELRRRVLADGWRAAYKSMVGEPADIPEDVALEGYLGGFKEETVEERELRSIRNDPQAAVREWLELWRSPIAWAGWRITARDRSCLDV